MGNATLCRTLNINFGTEDDEDCRNVSASSKAEVILPTSLFPEDTGLCLQKQLAGSHITSCAA